MEERDLEQLRQNEERLRLGLEGGEFAGVWDWNISTGQVIWSAGLEKIHGLSPGGFGGTIEAVVHEVHPEDREFVAESIRRTLEQKRDHNIEYRIIRPDGRVRWVMDRGRLYCDSSGTPMRMVGLCIDITDRKRTEEALQESNLKFRSVVEASNDAIIVANSSGTILSVNRIAEQMFGFGPELVGKSITVLMPERYEAVYREAIRRLNETGRTRLIGKTIELYGLRKDGSEFPIELSLSAWKIEDKSYFSGAIRDITKRRQAESSLEQKTSLIQLLQDVAVASNEAGAIEPALQFTLDRICASTGWPAGHVYFVSRSQTDELQPSAIWHLDDPERFVELKKITEVTTFKRGIGLPGRVLASENCEWVADISTGLVTQLADEAANLGVKGAFAFPVMIGAEVVAVLEFFSHDATPPDEHLLEVTQHIGALLGRVFERQRALELLRRAELRYRQLVESVQAIVWRADARRLQFTLVSRRAETILGYPVAEWIQNPTFWEDHIHPEDRDRVVLYRKKSVSLKQPYDLEYRMIAKDGRVVWLRDFVRILMENDEPTDLIGVMIDISLQKQSEEQLSRSRERLRALSAHLQSVREEERIKIAREIHDELGQMLTALKMDMALLNQGLMESSEVMPRKKLMREIGSMCDLVDRTIQMVRRIAAELRPEVLDHLDLKAAIQWQAQEFQKRYGIICRLRAKMDTAQLNKDQANQLFRIFQETLTNVARHSNASHVIIQLDQNKDRLVLEVRDNGRGITEAEITNMNSFGILGMRERAILLGGEVQIAGVPGKGTTVKVRVPLTKEHSAGS